VLFYELSQDPEEIGPGTAVPDHLNGDLKRYTVAYGMRRIRATFKFRELTRGERVLVISGRFRWPDNGQLDYAEAVVTATKANRAGKARMTTRDCAVEHRISYARNRATLSFPARCFGTPRWIQFNALILTMDSRWAPTYLYVDDVYPVFESGEGEVERFTRKIPRG